MEWDFDLSGVDTPDDDADVHTSGVIGDMVDAVKRGAGGLRDEAGKAIDRMTDAYEAAQRRRMLRLAALAMAAYLLLRGKR